MKPSTYLTSIFTAIALLGAVSLPACAAANTTSPPAVDGQTKSSTDVAAPAKSQPTPASLEKDNQPTSASDKALDEAVLWVPSAGSVVHFKSGGGRVNHKYWPPLKGLTHAQLVDLFPNYTDSRIYSRYWNPNKVHEKRGPDGIAVVVTEGTLSGQQYFVDLIAVNMTGLKGSKDKKANFMAHYELGMKDVTGIAFRGDQIDVTYLELGKDDAYCCPSVVKHITLRYNGGARLLPSTSK